MVFDNLVTLGTRTSAAMMLTYQFFLNIIVSTAEWLTYHDFDGLVKDCSNSSANALELLQPYTKPSICLCSFMPIVWCIAVDKLHDGKMSEIRQYCENGLCWHGPGISTVTCNHVSLSRLVWPYLDDYHSIEICSSFDTCHFNLSSG